MLDVLALFDISFYRFGADVPRCADVIACSPKGSVAPILFSQLSELLHQLAGTTPFEAPDNFGGRPLRRSRHKQMYVVGRYLQRQYLKLKLVCNLFANFLQPGRNWTNQNLFAIPGYPNKVVVDLIDRVLFAVDLRHTNILAERRGRFREPKVRPWLQPGVSAYEIL